MGLEQHAFVDQYTAHHHRNLVFCIPITMVAQTLHGQHQKPLRILRGAVRQSVRRMMQSKKQTNVNPRFTTDQNTK